MPSFDNKKFYKKSIAQYGISAQGVHWNSKYSQYKRFEILTSFIQKEIALSSIIDVGCGFAEYYNYLKKNACTPKKFIGIDRENAMTAISRQRFPHLDFHTLNILEDTLLKSDYYICSGAMNLLNEKEFFHFLTQCYAHSQKGFIFNFLKNESYNQIKSENVILFCQQLTKTIEIKDNYLDNDISIFLKR
ncbi:MAG: methyltransferase domain-containing protein [Candidatus Marinarcus sp.]|uniref:methyltransferase domain-containing protein n=1 Tax=Candidatus Marinarcus sp. TaxID=3100987 RepID=UPI003B0079A9